MLSLFTLILIPLVTAAGIALRPAAYARSTALIGSLVAAVATGALMWMFLWDEGAFQFEQSVQWLPSLGGHSVGVESGRVVEALGGVRLSVGVDSVALMLVALTSLLGPICVLASYTAINDPVK